MEKERIKHTLSVMGDWFVVQNAEERWWIERVVLWLVMEETEHSIEHVRACTSTGLPNVNDGDQYFVLGSDISPNGRTWQELHDNTPPSSVLVREITAEFA